MPVGWCEDEEGEACEGGLVDEVCKEEISAPGVFFDGVARGEIEGMGGLEGACGFGEFAHFGDVGVETLDCGVFGGFLLLWDAAGVGDNAVAQDKNGEGCELAAD